jgi:hypothetical protein
MQDSDSMSADDFQTLFEAACTRYGEDNVTDETYTEYPRKPKWAAVPKGTWKFEIDTQSSELDTDAVTDELKQHGYQVWAKGDNRFSDGYCPYKHIAIVTSVSDAVPKTDVRTTQ